MAEKYMGPVGKTLYEGALWLPWIQKRVLHKPADAFARTTACGIYVGKDSRARSTNLRTNSDFTACPDCFPEYPRA